MNKFINQFQNENFKNTNKKKDLKTSAVKT